MLLDTNRKNIFTTLEYIKQNPGNMNHRRLIDWTSFKLRASVHQKTPGREWPDCYVLGLFLFCFEGCSRRRAYHRLLDRKVPSRLSERGGAEFPRLLPAAGGWWSGAPRLPGAPARSPAVQIPLAGGRDQHLVSGTLWRRGQGCLWGLLLGVPEISHCLLAGFLAHITSKLTHLLPCLTAVPSCFGNLVCKASGSQPWLKLESLEKSCKNTAVWSTSVA